MSYQPPSINPVRLFGVRRLVAAFVYHLRNTAQPDGPPKNPSPCTRSSSAAKPGPSVARLRTTTSESPTEEFGHAADIPARSIVADISIRRLRACRFRIGKSRHQRDRVGERRIRDHVAVGYSDFVVISPGEEVQPVLLDLLEDPEVAAGQHYRDESILFGGLVISQACRDIG